ncbi:DUF3422 family protein [Neomegalonema sp.]|uniref:DUF3422 family protein n=1 Tax=Neomegalonema sp. TaxID=2039713 RepID=UPI0026258992|nr:DUF3422 domain-containing protein [Neomegalonema sp.]MDD2869481.1 DUF3422 domain-containing protein [Neomegalonema sp.]
MTPYLHEHPRRAALINELHARPAPALTAPCRMAHLAFKRIERAIDRDRSIDRAHMAALCARFGVAPPAPEAGHHFADFGRFRVKWEMHSEFVAYTIFAEGVSERPFAENPMRLLPNDWLASAPGVAVAAIHAELRPWEGASPGEAGPPPEAAGQFTGESLAGCATAGGAARVFGDFRLDAEGFTRFLMLTRPEASPRQMGRMAQRLLEIETYRAMSMLALPVMREIGPRLAEAESALVETTQAISAPERGAEGDDRASLARLTSVSAEIEAMTARTAFRLGAARAYGAILWDRIAALREERIEGVQTLQEFMTRRYAPAMRTVESGGERLENLSARATRASDLLRARVDVALAEQNQALLHSMDRRADLQLRLQETVEGLSVVAIGYYAVSLAGYLLGPLAAKIGVEPKILTALSVPPILFGVWLFLKRLKSRIAEDGGH